MAVLTVHLPIALSHFYFPSPYFTFPLTPSLDHQDKWNLLLLLLVTVASHFSFSIFSGRERLRQLLFTMQSFSPIQLQLLQPGNLVESAFPLPVCVSFCASSPSAASVGLYLSSNCQCLSPCLYSDNNKCLSHSADWRNSN